jgi:hypothetical protein
MFKSQSFIVNFVTCRSILYCRMNSTVGRNILGCCQRYNTCIDSLLACRFNVISVDCFAGSISDYWQKTSQFKASFKDSTKLQESWTYKTAKIFSRTRQVRPWNVDVLTNASKVLRGTCYYVNNSINDQRFQRDLIPCGSRLSFLNVFTMTIEWSTVLLKVVMFS